MPLSFPSSPSNGTVYTYGNKSYVYNESTDSWSIVPTNAYVGDLEPAVKSVGTIWFNPSTSNAAIWSGTEWKYFIPEQASGDGEVSLLAGDGILINTPTDPFRILNNPAPDPVVSNYFAEVVAISNSYVIAASRYGVNSGKAYIFNKLTGNLLHTLDNPNAYGTSESDNFGFSVAISDSYAIVGAMESDAGGGNSGKVYIFDTVTGNLLHTLDNPNADGTSVFDHFGYTIAISDSYLIVAAPYETDAGGSSSGKVYIFDTVTWTLLRTLDNPNAYGTSRLDTFGIALEISTSGSFLIAGAPSEDDAGGENSGKAYIFDTVTGNLLHTLDNPNAYGTSEYDKFGSVVSISDSYAIVGSLNEDDAGGENSGKAYIFDTVTGNLLHTLDNPNADGTSPNDWFASNVAISDSYAICGAYGESDAEGLFSGKVYVFDPVTGNLLYTINNPNAYGTSDEDYFSGWYRFGLLDSYLVVGAPGESDAEGNKYVGKAYIFNLENTDSFTNNQSTPTQITLSHASIDHAATTDSSILISGGEFTATTNPIISSTGHLIGYTTHTYTLPEGGNTLILDDNTTDSSRYLLFTDQTSGSVSDISVSSTKLFFNPSTGTLNATEFNSLSDVNFKENFNDIDNADEIIKSIKTYSFNWKETGEKSYGVIAQELEEILPELINNADGKKYVNYMPLISILLEGYKNLYDKIESK